MKGSFIVLLIATVLAAAPACGQDVPSNSIASPFHAGLRTDYLENFHQTNSEIVAGCPQCGTFSNGTGSGYEFQLFGEVPFNFFRRLDLGFGAGVAQRGGAFGQTVTNGEQILDPNSNTYVPYMRENSFTASLIYIDLSCGVRFLPLKNFAGYCSAMFDAGIPAGRSTNYKQTESIVSPQGVVYPQTNSTSLTDGQGVIDGVNTLFGLTATIGYELPFGPVLTASPELSYYFPLNSVATSRVWHVSSASVGVAIRWNRPPTGILEEPVPIPEKSKRPPIVAREDPNAFAPKLSAATIASQSLHIIETTVTETFPILPYIFFDSASAALPDRYAEISSSDADQFKESDLPHRSLESYYQILNVVGSRMRANPSASLIINGTTDGREGKDEAKDNANVLANQRAISVQGYLAKIWQISPKRLIVTTTDEPKNPSSTEYPEGFEENRRVELSSDNDQVLKPIVHERFREESALPKEIPITLSANTSIGVRDWRLAITSHNSSIYATSGHGTPPNSIAWKPDDAQVALLAKTLSGKDSLVLHFEATASNGAHSSEQIAVPASKSINPYELSRLSLIVFDFDQSSIDEQNQRMISQFVANSIYRSSTVSITGSTDNLGELAHNQKLSQDRAFNVRDLILGNKADAVITSTKGIGPSNLLYDNHLPEGRYYCRTVKVEVQTPLDSILTVPK